MLPRPTSPPADPFRAQSILRQHPPARLQPEDLAEPIPLPPPFASRYEVFSWHYLYHLARRLAAGMAARPSLGELTMTSHLSRSMCRRYRDQLERDLPLLPATGHSVPPCRSLVAKTTVNKPLLV